MKEKTAVISLRISPELKAKVEEAADNNDRSTQSQIIYMIKEYLSKCGTGRIRPIKAEGD